MRKLLFFSLILLVIMLISSIPALGYKTQTFEYGVWGDSIWGWQATRCFNNHNDIHFTTIMAHKSNQSVMLPLVDSAPLWCWFELWLLYCKSAFWANGICTDSVFMHEVSLGDEVEYWIYVPTGAHVDSIMAFVRDSDWRWGLVSNYQASDLTFGAWNRIVAPISDTNYAGEPIRLPLLQFDLWIYTDTNFPMNVGCTLYMDDVTTRDANGGITPPEKGQIVLNITGNSINCIEYSLSSPAHILIEIFNLTGQKVAVEVPGKQLEGPHKIYVDLPSGIYLAKITADKVKGVSKFISVEK